MNGVTPPDRARTHTDAAHEAPTRLARLKLTQALNRAKYAIAWERAWPHLARLLTVIGLFLVVSWAGLWLSLPLFARAIGIVLFVLLAFAAACRWSGFAGRAASRA